MNKREFPVRDGSELFQSLFSWMSLLNKTEEFIDLYRNAQFQSLFSWMSLLNRREIYVSVGDLFVSILVLVDVALEQDEMRRLVEKE